MTKMPRKITELNITSSIAVGDHMDLITFNNDKYTKL